VHDWGGQVIHDVTSIRFAEKAISAGVNGVICIGGGSGTVSHLALVPKVRSMFDGTIVLAGAVTTGAAVRAAEVLGTDLAYVGTRFIATHESLAAPDYKRMLVDGRSRELARRVPGQAGIDLTDLAKPRDPGDYSHLPPDVRPWLDIWSAGQGIQLINSILSVDEVVARLRDEYAEAGAVPVWPVEPPLPATKETPSMTTEQTTEATFEETTDSTSTTPTSSATKQRRVRSQRSATSPTSAPRLRRPSGTSRPATATTTGCTPTRSTARARAGVVRSRPRSWPRS
jgi:nitronate monooxygenase